MSGKPGLRWKHALIATLAGFPLLFYNLYGLHQKQAYISDDVIQQLVVSDWQAGQPRNAVLGEDTYVLKMPFYAALNKVATGSPQTILLTSVVFLFIMLFLFNLFQFAFHKSLPFGVTVSLLLASWGGYELFWLRSPDMRNVELPLALLTAWGMVYWLKERRRHYWPYGLLIVATALQTVNDPYVLYVIIFPAFLALLMTAKDKLRVLKLGAVGLISAAALWQLLIRACQALGVSMINQPVKPPIGLHAFASAATSGIQGLAWVLGNKQLESTVTVHWLSLASLLLTGLGMVYFVLLFKDKRSRLNADGRLLFWYGLAIIIVDLGVYVASGLAKQDANHRYMVMAVFGWLMILLSLRPVLTKKLVYGLAGGLIALHLATNLAWAASQPRVDNTKNAGLIERFMDSNHTKLGFSDYWDGNINTYYANNRIKLLPIICTNGNFVMYKWATNLSNFPANLNDQRFVVFVNMAGADSPTGQHYRTSTCDANDMRHIFGDRIKKIERIDANRSLLLVDKPG